MDVSVELISGALASAADDYGNALRTWYPQHGDNAPAERNLTLCLALALRARLPAFRLYAESSLGMSSRERIDLVGYEPEQRALVVIEAKRFLEKSAGGLLEDVDRIQRFVPTNDNAQVEVSRKFGVVVTQTIAAENAEWWTSAPPRERDGLTWSALADHLTTAVEVGGRRESRCVYEWPREEVTHRRWVLWSIWPVASTT